MSTVPRASDESQSRREFLFQQISARDPVPFRAGARDLHSLRDAEILALLLSKDSKAIDVVQLARVIDEKGAALRREDLAPFPHIDDADATLVLAAIQMASRRLKLSDVKVEPRPTAARLAFGAVAGGSYLVLASLGLAAIQGGVSIVWTFVSLTVSLLGTLFLCLELGHRGAHKKNIGHLQMRLSSLFLWVTVASFNLVVIRAFINSFNRNQSPLLWQQVFAAIIVWLIFMAISAPFVMLLGESLLWVSSDLVRTPRMQRWLRSIRPGKSSR